MKFAFLVHPLSRETTALLNFDADGRLLANWGIDAMGVAAGLNQAVSMSRAGGPCDRPPQVSIFDELGSLMSPAGAVAEGRVYEIPLDAYGILNDPDRALAFMEEAVE